MEHLSRKAIETSEFIKAKSKLIPEVAVILGTGLTSLGGEIEDAVEILYEELPHSPVSTVEFHEGKLVIGRFNGKVVMAMYGRFHYYEGYSMKEVSFPVRVMQELGVKTLIVSNAAGGMAPFLDLGDMMLIHDHINLMGDNPLIGPHDDKWGPRFPDMSEPYSKRLLALAQEAAGELGLTVKKGVYVAVAGPNLETSAEYRMLATFADAVGMSTVPEVLVAVQAGMEVLGISCITDKCVPYAIHPVAIEEIIRVANEAEPKIQKLVGKVIEKL